MYLTALDSVYSAATITATSAGDANGNNAMSATLKVDALISSTDTFVVNAEDSGTLSLNNVSSATLTAGSLYIESSELTVTFVTGTTTYKINNGGGSDDFIVTAGDSTTARIAGITEGESFVLYNGTASTTYTMDAVGVYAEKANSDGEESHDNAAQQRVLKGKMGTDSGVNLSDLNSGDYVIAVDGGIINDFDYDDSAVNLTIDRYTALPAQSSASVVNTDNGDLYGYLSNTTTSATSSNTYVFTSNTNILTNISLDFTADSETERFSFTDFNKDSYSGVDSATATFAMINYNGSGTFEKLTVSDGNIEISRTSTTNTNDSYELYKDASFTYSGTTYTSLFNEGLDDNLIFTGRLNEANFRATNFVNGASFQIAENGTTTTYTNILGVTSDYQVMKKVELNDAESTTSYYIYSSTSLVTSNGVYLNGLRDIGSKGLFMANALENEEALTITYDSTAKTYAGKVYVDYLNEDLSDEDNALSKVYAQVTYNNGTYTVTNKGSNTTILSIDFGTSLESGETVNADTFAANTLVTFEGTESSLYTINGSKYIAGDTSSETTLEDGTTESNEAGLLQIITGGTGTSKSALYSGLVKLNNTSSSVTVAEGSFASETIISVTEFGTDSTITVSADGKAGVASMAVSALDVGEAFTATLDGVTYKFQMTDKGLQDFYFLHCQQLRQ